MARIPRQLARLGASPDLATRAQFDNYVGPYGEVLVDDEGDLYPHNGVTPGGFGGKGLLAQAKEYTDGLAVNIERFGALPGSGGVSAAIQDAINSVPSGAAITLAIGPGTFLLDSDVSYNGRIVSFVVNAATEFTGPGKIGDYPGRLPYRLYDRLFVGRALDANDGGEFFTAVGKDWLETEVGSTTTTDTIVALSPTGYGAIMGGSRTSDNPLEQSEGTRGISGIVIADKVGDFSAYAIYGESRREGNAGWAHIAELDIISRPGTVPGSEAITTPLLTPSSPFNARSLTGPWVSVGRPDVEDCGDASVGYAIVNNAGARAASAGRVRIGLLIDQRAILTEDGSIDGSAQGDAVALGRNHRVGWWNSTATARPSSAILASQTVGDVQQLDFADAGLSHTFGGGKSFVAYAVTGHVNHLRLTGNASGFGPTLSADGADANIDLRLSGKGTGVVDIQGPALAGASGASAGFLTIRYGGNLVKVQVYQP